MLRKALRIALALTIPLGTIAVLLWLFASTRGWYAPTTANSLVKVVEGNEVYMVPANYIWSGRDRESALNGQVNFHMLYPGAEPLTKENAKTFKLPGRAGGRLVNFILMPKKETWFLKHYRQVEKEAQEKDQVTKLGDWLQMPSTKGYVLLKKKSMTGDDIYIECVKPAEHIKSLSCDKYFTVTDSTYVSFTFSMDRLDEWQNIEIELITLINSFKIKN